MTETASSETQTRRFQVYGRVQGVGFRYTTSRIAKQYSVSGYVKNCSDGTVEIVVCGTNHSSNQFLNDVRSTFASNITEFSEEQIDQLEQFTSFRIRY